LADDVADESVVFFNILRDARTTDTGGSSVGENAIVYRRKTKFGSRRARYTYVRIKISRFLSSLEYDRIPNTALLRGDYKSRVRTTVR